MPRTVAKIKELAKNLDIWYVTANSAAQAYLICNDTWYERNQTATFIKNLKKIDKVDEESVKKEVSNWIQGYGLFGRKSAGHEDSREFFARHFGLIK